MHPISNFMLAAATCVALAPLCAAEPQAPPKYRVTILSDFNTSGNVRARGYSIDDIGIVAGSYRLADNSTHASLWVLGQQIDLETLGKGTNLSSRVQWPVKNILGLVSGISLTDALDPNHEGWSCGAFLLNPISMSASGSCGIRFRRRCGRCARSEAPTALRPARTTMVKP
jgi:hypothetical protein